MAFIADAQNRHQTFKGIEIDGTRSEFVAKLVKEGYTVISQNEIAVILAGKFAGEDVNVVIPSSPEEIVWKVAVFFEESNSWMQLKYEYDNFKEALTGKYGEGVSYEYFKMPYFEGDGNEITALEQEKCVYATFFNTENGSIGLELSKFKHLTINYEDNINNEVRKQKRSQDYLKDL